MDADSVKRNISDAAERIARATPAGRKVTLVAATKTVPAELVKVLSECGVTDVGENRVQEYLSKRDAFEGFTRHFIGTLQRNKAKYLVGDVALIQSVSNAPLALEIDSVAEKKGVVQDVLVEVNIGGEQSKTGAYKCDVGALVEFMRDLKHVRLRGLMAMPPKDAADGVYDEAFEMYSSLADGFEHFDTLSIGMSGDFERAIRAGSNMVRLGTALFGPRA